MYSATTAVEIIVKAFAFALVKGTYDEDIGLKKHEQLYTPHSACTAVHTRTPTKTKGIRSIEAEVNSPRAEGGRRKHRRCQDGRREQPRDQHVRQRLSKHKQTRQRMGNGGSFQSHVTG